MSARVAVRLAMDFGDFVRALRSGFYLSQTELGERSGLTQSRIARIELGARPSKDEIACLARALGVSDAVLTGRAAVELQARDPFAARLVVSEVV